MDSSVILTRKKFTSEKFLSQVKITAPSAVKKVLSTKASGFIKNGECTSKVLTMSGKLTVSAVYLSDLNTVESASFELDFIEKQQTAYELTNLFFEDYACVESVSVAGSEIMVTVSHLVGVSGIFNYELANFDGEQNNFVTKKSIINTNRLVLAADDDFVVAEESDSNIKNMQVLFERANVVLGDVTCGVDKVVVEGKILTEVFEQDGESFGLVSKEFEFKQEISAEGVTPNMTAQVGVLVKSVKVTPEQSDDKTTLVYAIDLYAKLYVYEDYTYEFVTDMFSLKNELKTANEYVESKVYKSTSSYSDNCMVSTDISSIESFDDVLGVFDAKFECSEAKKSDGKLCIFGKLCADALVKTDSGVGKLSIESDVDFVTVSEDDFYVGEVKACVEIASFKVKAGKELEVNFKINYSVTNEADLNLCYVKNYEVGREKSENDSAIRVYVTRSGENLFDVARALNVRPELISKQNDVSDIFDSGEKIYIYSPINLI